MRGQAPAGDRGVSSDNELSFSESMQATPSSRLWYQRVLLPMDTQRIDGALKRHAGSAAGSFAFLFGAVSLLTRSNV
jgi:hypothetical protein